MASTKLANKAVGSIIKLKESGSLVEFIVCKHDYENGLNGNGRTLIVRKDCYDIRAFSSSNNAFSGSSMDTWLNNTWLKLLDADIQAAVSTTKFYCIAGNGSSTKQTLTRAVFLLSATELGKGSYNDGTALASAVCSQLAIAYRNGSAVTQWTRTPYPSSTYSVYYLNTNGDLRSSYYSSSGGSRPAFTLPSSLSVSDDGSVSVNSAPTITSTTASGTNLGLKNAGFNLAYTVADADGDAVTVKEYLDDVLQRSFTATLGQAVNFQAVTAANFQKVLNGTHTLKVVANDGKEDSAPYTVSFSKKVTTATVTLSTALSADDAITVMIMNIVGSLLSDAALKVLVTNNANDPSPVWEDATADVKAGTNHVFTNKTAANGFAFNFKLTVSRGASDVGGYISNIGGAFE